MWLERDSSVTGRNLTPPQDRTLVSYAFFTVEIIRLRLF